MDNKLTEDFLARVDEIVKSEEDKDRFFQALRDYRNTFDMDELMQKLRALMITPERLALYDAIRPLIPINHQISYDRRTLWASTQRRLRVVRLSLRDLAPNTKLGFALRGGLEHGVGFFVSQVMPDSLAARAGLREGDQVVRINGFLIEHATHNEVIALIRSRPDLLLKVRRVGMLPKKEQFDDNVSWVASTTDSNSEAPNLGDSAIGGDIVRLYINTRGAHSLGCTVISGSISQPGIFIQAVTPGGLAAQAGVRRGDQILSVNGIPFLDITHAEAIVTLKGSSGLLMTLRRGAGLGLLNNVDDDTALEQQKVAQLQALTTSRPKPDTEVKMTVTRRIEERETSRIQTSDSTADGNTNVFFRRPDSLTSSPTQNNHREAPRSPPITNSRNNNDVWRHSPSPVDSPPPQQSPKRSQTTSSVATFSQKESGGREVESLRLTSRPPVWVVSGIELEEVPGGRLAVAQVEYGSPAFQADVHKGDYLLAVEDEKVSGKRLDAVKKLLMKAELKSEYILTLGRAPSGIFDDEVTYF